MSKPTKRKNRLTKNKRMNAVRIPIEPSPEDLVHKTMDGKIINASSNLIDAPKRGIIKRLWARHISHK